MRTRAPCRQVPLRARALRRASHKPAGRGGVGLGFAHALFTAPARGRDARSLMTTFRRLVAEWRPPPLKLRVPWVSGGSLARSGSRLKPPQKSAPFPGEPRASDQGVERRALPPPSRAPHGPRPGGRPVNVPARGGGPTAWGSPANAVRGGGGSRPDALPRPGCAGRAEPRLPRVAGRWRAADGRASCSLRGRRKAPTRWAPPRLRLQEGPRSRVGRRS